MYTVFLIVLGIALILTTVFIINTLLDVLYLKIMGFFFKKDIVEILKARNGKEKNE